METDWYEIRERVRLQVHTLASRRVGATFSYMVWDQAWDEIRDPITSQVEDPVLYQIWRELENGD